MKGGKKKVIQKGKPQANREKILPTFMYFPVLNSTAVEYLKRN